MTQPRSGHLEALEDAPPVSRWKDQQPTARSQAGGNTVPAAYAPNCPGARTAGPTNDRDAKRWGVGPSAGPALLATAVDAPPVPARTTRETGQDRRLHRRRH